MASRNIGVSDHDVLRLTLTGADADTDRMTARENTRAEAQPIPDLRLILRPSGRV